MNVAQLVVRLRSGAGGGLCLVRRGGSDRHAKLLDFFFDLAENLIEAFRVVGPIEADA